MEIEYSNFLDDYLPISRRLYLLSVTISIIWIVVITAGMVVFAERLGCMLDINSFMIGHRMVLAAGTSVPDALATSPVYRLRRTG